MVCIARMKGMTMRHDLLLGAWRRIAHRAGVATAVEPAMERLRAGTGRVSYYTDINLSYFLFPINSMRCLSYLLLGLVLGSISLVERIGLGLDSDVGLLSESQHARLCMANWD
jgi:hypothetical protein